MQLFPCLGLAAAFSHLRRPRQPLVPREVSGHHAARSEMLLDLLHCERPHLLAVTVKVNFHA